MVWNDKAFEMSASVLDNQERAYFEQQNAVYADILIASKKYRNLLQVQI